MLEDCRNLLKGRPFEKSNEATPILADFEKKVNALKIDNSERDELVSNAERALVDSLQPAYLDLIEFLDGQEQRATSEAGAWKFPHGEAFYTHTRWRMQRPPI